MKISCNVINERPLNSVPVNYICRRQQHRTINRRKSFPRMLMVSSVDWFNLNPNDTCSILPLFKDIIRHHRQCIRWHRHFHISRWKQALLRCFNVIVSSMTMHLRIKSPCVFILVDTYRINIRRDQIQSLVCCEDRSTSLHNFDLENSCIFFFFIVLIRSFSSSS